METGRGEMRPCLETALLEVLNVDGQGIGELTVTTLTNEFMPLIRYHIGDLVERRERPYHTNYIVQGRAADAFVAPDGRRVTTWQVDQCLADLPGIAHYQLCERAAGEWLLRFVPDVTPPTAAQTEELRRRLALLLGAGNGLAVQQTDLLVPESSGKFRLGYPAKRNA
jgi:phenylacetate-coenzyme A ligase PaaK-like adenylate-forming protein